jgi:hypothetical protein
MSGHDEVMTLHWFMCSVCRRPYRDEKDACKHTPEELASFRLWKLIEKLEAQAEEAAANKPEEPGSND